MMPRTEYEMDDDDLETLLKACRSVPMLVIAGDIPSAQENTNNAWARLGEKLGFDGKTVRPALGGQKFFTAVPLEPEDRRVERLAYEAEIERQAEMSKLEAEIDDRRVMLKELAREDKQENA